MLENSFELSSWFSVTKVSEANFLNFYFRLCWLRIAFFMECWELWRGILGFLDSLLYKFHSFDLTCTSHIMTNKGVDYLKIFTLIFNVFFAFKCHLNFLWKTVGLGWITLLYNNFGNILSCKCLIFQNRDILNT